jgi:hypothetical protein
MNGQFLIPQSAAIALPDAPSAILPALGAISASLGIPRDVLASDQEIAYAWRDLPRELNAIPANLRGELIARMCVAVSVGLFDGAINYIWNASILHLREKVRNFGLPVVASIKQGDFEEKNLVELQDSRLLELCLKLNLIDEDGFFFLDQCRDIRNNFSAAHPTLGQINDREFTVFVNRCIRYALAGTSSPRGVDISAFIAALKGARFSGNQLPIWSERLRETHAAQRQLMVQMVHGIYCDQNTAELARLNALDICRQLVPTFTNSVKSSLIDKHTEFGAKGDAAKHAASLQFFENLGLLPLLNESDQHFLFSRAIERLQTVHAGMNNFYNEPPFAERLLELSQQSAVPETAQEAYVVAVACCRVGNGYGVCNAAVASYDKMIRGFSPREIAAMLRCSLARDNPLGARLGAQPSCRGHFRSLLGLLDEASIPAVAKPDFDRWMRPAAV